MSIIPTALGGGQRLDQLMMATDVFDTPGTSSWIHPSPGTALEVQVVLVGGAGGGTTGAGSAAGNGTPSIWDHGGSPVTANGGTGAPNGTSAGTGFIDGTEYDAGTVGDHGRVSIMGGLYGNAGHNLTYNSSVGIGGSGYVNQFRTTVTNNVNIITGQSGSAGSSEISDSQAGAVIVSYAKAAVGIPAPVQKEFVEEWLDYDSTVSGSGTWSHPRPGQAITMTVIAVGGAGGNASSTATGVASSGSASTFDSVTAAGGNPGSNAGSGANPVTNGLGGSVINGSSGGPGHLGFGRLGAITVGTFDGAVGYTGGTGAVEYKRITVTSDVNYTIGSGGAGVNGTVGSGNHGGIILKYSY